MPSNPHFQTNGEFATNRLQKSYIKRCTLGRIKLIPDGSFEIQEVLNKQKQQQVIRKSIQILSRKNDNIIYIKNTLKICNKNGMLVGMG